MNRKFLASGLGIIAVFAVCVAYIFGGVLDTPLLRATPTVTVEMPRTGGLFKGSEVTYRGVKVGKVKDITLAGDGVEATIVITWDVKIPANSKAKVRSLSPVGEQYLDLRPSGTSGPFLEDGSVIQASAVDLPQSLGGTAISLNKLIEQVDPKQIGEVLEEVSTGLSGTEMDLRRMVVQGTKLLKTFDENLPLTERVLNQGETILQIGVDNTNNLERIAGNSALFAAWLRRFDPTFFAILKEAPGQLDTMRKLIIDIGDTLPPLLDETINLTDLTSARDPHLRELMVEFPQGINALASIIRGGVAQLDVIAQRGTVCQYSTTPRGPRDTSFRKLQDQGRCSTSLSVSQRGAQFAPPPVR